LVYFNSEGMFMTFDFFNYRSNGLPLYFVRIANVDDSELETKKS